MDKGTIGSVVGLLALMAIGSPAAADESRRVTGEGMVAGCLDPEDAATQDLELAEGELHLLAEADAAQKASVLCGPTTVVRRIGGYAYLVTRQVNWTCSTRETVRASARFACVSRPPPAPPAPVPPVDDTELCMRRCMSDGTDQRPCMIRCYGWR